MDGSTTQTEPLHQYATVAPASQPLPPVQPVYQQYPVTTPLAQPVVANALSAGLLGLIVVGTGTMGVNLHRVQDGEMSMSEALSNSLTRGAAGGAAAAGATAAAATLTSGGLVGLAVTLVAGTGISYMLSK